MSFLDYLKKKKDQTLNTINTSVIKPTENFVKNEIKPVQSFTQNRIVNPANNIYKQVKELPNDFSVGMNITGNKVKNVVNNVADLGERNTMAGKPITEKITSMSPLKTMPTQSDDKFSADISLRASKLPLKTKIQSVINPNKMYDALNLTEEQRQQAQDAEKKKFNFGLAIAGLNESNKSVGNEISNGLDALRKAKYEKTYNLQEKNDSTQLSRILGEDRVKQLQSGDYSFHRNPDNSINYWEDLVKANIIDKKPQTISESLNGKIKPYKLDSDTVFHGTTQDNVSPILSNGFKSGSELPENAFRGGGHGETGQKAISFSTDEKQASVFGGLTPKGSVLEAKLKPNSKVVTIEGIDYAEDLNDMIPELRRQGIDAVYLDGEKEVAVINKKSVKPTGRYQNFNAKDGYNQSLSTIPNTPIKTPTSPVETLLEQNSKTIPLNENGKIPTNNYFEESQKALKKQAKKEGLKQKVVENVVDPYAEIKFRPGTQNHTESYVKLNTSPNAARNELETTLKVHNDILSQLKGTQEKTAYEQLRQLLTLKDNAKRGLNTPLSVSEIDYHIAQLKSQLGDRFNVVQKAADDTTKMFNDLLDKMPGISEETKAAYLQENPNYSPLQAIREDVNANIAGKAPGTVNKSNFKGRKGFSGYYNPNTIDVERKAMSNMIQGRYKQDVVDTLAKEYGQEVGFRNTENAYLPGQSQKVYGDKEHFQRMIDLYKQAKELRPIQNTLDRFLKTRNKWARTLEKQISKLNEEGLYTYLKRTSKENTTIQSSVKQVDKYKKNLVDIGTDKFYAPEATPSSTKLTQKYATPTKKQFRTIINNLVNTPPSELAKIKAKIATRENHLGPLLDEIEQMSGQLQTIKEARFGMKNEARGIRQDFLTNDIPQGMEEFAAKTSDGKIYAVPPKINEYLQNLEQKNNTVVSGLFGTSNKLFRVGATTGRIPFIITNPMGDTWNYAVNRQKVNIGTLGELRALGKATISSFKEAFGKIDDIAKAQKEAGGEFGGAFSSLPKEIKIPWSIQSTGQKVKNSVASVISLPYNLISGAGQVMERIPRRAEFNRLQQAGKSVGESALGGLDVTANFGRFGKSMRSLNELVPFLNAMVQGNYSSYQAFRETPLYFLAKMGAYVVAPTVGVSLWNKATGKDDQVDETTKENYLYFITPWQTQNSNGENVPVLLKFRKKELPGTVSDVVRKLIDGESVGQIGKEYFSKLPMNTLNTITPPAIKAPMEVASNYNMFTGTPIVPQSNQGLVPGLQVSPYTSDTFRAIGERTNLSPAKIQQFVSDIFPAISQITPITDKFANPQLSQQQDKRTQLEKIASYLPLIGVPKGDTKTAQQIYDIVNKMDQQTATRNYLFKQAYQNGDMATANQLSQGMSKQTLSSLISSAQTNMAKQNMTPTEKALSGLSDVQKQEVLSQLPGRPGVAEAAGNNTSILPSSSTSKTVKLPTMPKAKSTKIKVKKIKVKTTSPKAPKKFKVKTVKVAKVKGTKLKIKSKSVKA